MDDSAEDLTPEPRTGNRRGSEGTPAASYANISPTWGPKVREKQQTGQGCLLTPASCSNSACVALSSS